ARAVGAGLLVVMAVCGVASLGLEVVWTRMLVLVVGTSTYAFVTMLASFLVGIALGSFIARAIIDRIGDVRRSLGWVQVGIAVTTLATLPVLGGVTESFGARWLSGTESAWLGMILSRFGVSFLVMLVPTTLIGMTFPLAGKIWAREVHSLGGRLGQVYGANTLGNILGAGLTGFLILPALGLQRSVALLAALSLANAAWGLYPAARGGLWARVPRGLAVAGGLALLVGLFVWQPRPLVGGESEGREILYYEEGLVATTMVYRDANDRRKQSMAVDRIKIGDSYGDVDMKQQCLAHFPLLLMPQHPPRLVLSIGLGTGILIGETLKHPGVERLDCVEIAPTVIEGARTFAEFNDRVLQNPRANIVCDDGVNFLRRSEETYEAIISDAKSRTSHAGNALFFSLDYYELCHEHLARDGVMIQWIPLNVPTSELPIILRSFAVVFPHTYVWVDPPASCFLVGTKEPLVLDLPHVQTVLDAPATENLRRYGWRNAHGFAGLLAADRPALEPWLEEGRAINSLEHPLLEFYSPGDFSVPEPKRVAGNLSQLERVWQLVETVAWVGADAERLDACRRAGQRMTHAMRLLEPEDSGETARAMEMISEALALAPDHGRLQFTAANEFFERANDLGGAGRFDAAVAYLRRAIDARPDFAEAHFNLGNALASRQRIAEAALHFRRVVELLPDFPGGHFNLANTLASQGQYAEAAQHYRRTLELQPNLPAARERLRRVLQLQQQPPGARSGSAVPRRR
ncbi:MAG: tetratricopeptide repeat protein, partial [Candidatus Eisenbacteria bacterium]|nr:tetratricopeptide repeat protein [Candidatus Eisenbacteria bacterium]